MESMPAVLVAGAQSPSRNRRRVGRIAAESARRPALRDSADQGLDLIGA
jgi:hypothetical protein